MEGGCAYPVNDSGRSSLSWKEKRVASIKKVFEPGRVRDQYHSCNRKHAFISGCQLMKM